MKRSPDTQINAFFSLNFFYYGRPSAQLDRRNGLLSTSVPVEQTALRREIKGLMDNGYKSALYNFLAGTSKEQFLDKGIRQKSTKTVNSFIVCSAFCPGPPNRDPMDSEKQLHVYTSGRTMARHVWRVDKAPGHPRRNRNACLKVLRLSMGKIFACQYGIQWELVKISSSSLGTRFTWKCLSHHAPRQAGWGSKTSSQAHCVAAHLEYNAVVWITEGWHGMDYTSCR